MIHKMAKIKRILVTDDSSTTRGFIKKVLVDAGFQVIEASNGVEALLLINREVPDLLMLDLLMPDMDGLEVLEKLKTASIKVPTIVITADIQEQVKEECFELGARDFLNKPVTAETILNSIRKING